MAADSIGNLDERVKHRLRVRAARHGRSMEAEIRCILEEAAREEETVREPDESEDLFTTLMERFQALGGVELDIPPRSDLPREVKFD